ncbi:hypothetical protein BOX15_Mlig018817g2, partial [Macrostomum lignano]
IEDSKSSADCYSNLSASIGSGNDRSSGSICNIRVSVRLPRLGSLPIVCLAGVRRLALGSLSNRQDAVDRIRLSIDDCANQLLVECLGADEADLEMLQSRCYELSGPTAVPASPSPVIQGTVGIEDPAEASGCSLASAVATGFPPGWIRRCQLTLWRHSCLILAGPLHCSKRHAARHLAEAMQRRAQLDGLSMRQLSHDCLDWEAFDAWLAAAGLGDDSDADDDADNANDAGRDSAATDGGEDSPALWQMNASQQRNQPQVLLLQLHRLEFVLDSPSLASLLHRCRRSNRQQSSRRLGGRQKGRHRRRLILLGSLGASDLTGVPQSLLLDAVPDAGCWTLLSVLEQPVSGLAYRCLKLRWRQLLAESVSTSTRFSSFADSMPPILSWIGNLPEQCNRCLMKMLSSLDRQRSLDHPIGPSMFLSCPVTLDSDLLEEQIPVWLANLWNSRLVNIVARSLGPPSASADNAQPCLLAKFIRCAIASQCPLRPGLVEAFLSGLIGYQPEPLQHLQPDTEQLQLDQPQLQPDQPQLQLDQPQLQPDQEKLQSDPEKLQLDPEKLQSEQEKLQLDPEKLQSEQEKLQPDPEKLQLDPEKLLLDPEKLQPDPEKLQLDQEKLQSDQEKLQSDQEKLQSDQEKLQSDQEKLQSDPEKLQSDQEKLQSGQEKLQSDPEKLQSDQEELQSDQEELPSDQEKLQPEQQKLQSEEQSLQSEEQSLQSEQQSLQPEQQKLQPEQQKLQPEQQKLQPEQQSLQPEQQKLQPEQQSLQPEQQKLQPEQQKLQPEQQSLQSEQQSLQADSTPSASDADQLGQIGLSRTSRKRPKLPQPLQLFAESNSDSAIAVAAASPLSKRSLSASAPGSSLPLVTEVSEGLESLRQLSQQLLGEPPPDPGRGAAASFAGGGTQTLFRRRRNLAASSSLSETTNSSALSLLPPSTGFSLSSLTSSASSGSLLNAAVVNRRRQLFGGGGGGGSSSSASSTSLRRHRHQSYN